LVSGGELGLNYSTAFLILLTLGFGAYALRLIWRAYAACSADYLWFFFTRLAADFTLTMALSALYLTGMPLYSVESWSHGTVLLALLFVVGAACIFVATEAQVATVLSLASLDRRRQFTVAYVVLVVGIVGTAGFAALTGSLQVSLSADRAMLALAVLSRLLALCTSALLIFRYRNQRGRTARTALLYAGGFFILTDGSWLAMYALGMMGFLHARLYDGLHLTRLLLLFAIVVVYLGRFLDAFEGTGVAGFADEQLDPRLVAKHGICRREGRLFGTCTWDDPTKRSPGSCSFRHAR